MCDEAFSSVDIVHQCLIDEKRTRAYGRAIEKKVSKGDVVLDAGSGSGILALFSARAGAKKVIALENDRYVAEIIRGIVKKNGYEKVIDVRVGDARNFKFGKIKFDVVVMELLTTGMVDEFQVEAMNNLHLQKVLKRTTSLIPSNVQTSAFLVNAKYDMYGFDMTMVKHLWNNLSQNQKYDIISTGSILNSLEFSKKNSDECKISLFFLPKKKSKVNGVLLKTKISLAEGITLDDTETLNAPVIVPVDEFQAEKGKKIALALAYKFGKGYKNFSVRKNGSPH